MTTNEHLRMSTYKIILGWLRKHPTQRRELQRPDLSERERFHLVSECLLRMEGEDVLLPEGSETYIDAAFDRAAFVLGGEE